MPAGDVIPATSSVNSSATVVTLLAANADRVGGTFYNSSTQVLYLKYGSGASTTDFTVAIASNTFWEMPHNYVYKGIITGIWASANGSVKITEFE